MLLLVALAMAGSITWLTTMRTALSATQQSGGFGGEARTLPSGSTDSPQIPQPLRASSTLSSRDAAVEHSPQITTNINTAIDGTFAAAADSTQPDAGATLPDMGQLWAYRACPPGCVDLGLIAEVLGLPWPCFCQVWLLGDLIEQLQKVSIVMHNHREYITSAISLPHAHMRSAYSLQTYYTTELQKWISRLPA